MFSKTHRQANKGKYILWLIALGCFSFLAFLMVLSGRSDSTHNNRSDALVMQNTKVEVTPISMQTFYTRERTIFGKIEPTKQSNVGFELAGILQNVMVYEGQTVEQGQALATLNLARLEAQENELKAALTRAQADARLAQLSTSRIADIVTAQWEPQQRLDESQAALEVAQALVNEAIARLATVQLEQQKSTLLAPYDAQVLSKVVDEGTVLSIGQPVFLLLSASMVEARFGLPQDTAFALEKGQEHTLHLGESSVLAVVKSVAKQRDLRTRTIDTVLSIDRSLLSPIQLMSLMSGDLVSMNVTLKIHKKGAWVPLSALSSGVRGLWSVLVYQPASSTLETRAVRVEYFDSQHAFVSGAIEQAEQLVINGTHRFTPGQTVNQVLIIDALASVNKVALMSSKLTK